MKYRFSIEDNIWVFQDLAEKNYSSIFENQYLGFLKSLHDEFGTKVHLNVFYETEGFNLSQMPDKYKSEWEKNSPWLRLSFHSMSEFPGERYENATYDEAKRDCEKVQNEIIRFAGEKTLSRGTSIHYVIASKETILALKDCGIKIMAGMFGTPEEPNKSYHLGEDVTNYMHSHTMYNDPETGMPFVNTDMVINKFALEDIVPSLTPCIGKDFVEIMIHEQYYHEHYPLYQPDYEDKVRTAVKLLCDNGYEPTFLEELI